MYGFRWKPYVSVAERRRKAERQIARMNKGGSKLQGVAIAGRTIAHTFWGRAWCDNLERYSDFSNRLPRGRTYVRNGSVIDLQVQEGEVNALVSGSSIYKTRIQVASVSRAQWEAICTDCAGGIDSLVELLQGRFSKGVMERICRPGTGLFPAPKEIQFSCSCPDWAYMCKHVAAVLYGIGSRLDSQPELLFRLRQVDHMELISKAGQGLPLSKEAPPEEKILAEEGLSELFGLELAATSPPAKPQTKRKPKPAGSVSAPAKASAAQKATLKRTTPGQAKKSAAAKVSPKSRTLKKAPVRRGAKKAGKP